MIKDSAEENVFYRKDIDLELIKWKMYCKSCPLAKFAAHEDLAAMSRDNLMADS